MTLLMYVPHLSIPVLCPRAELCTQTLEQPGHKKIKTHHERNVYNLSSSLNVLVTIYLELDHSLHKPLSHYVFYDLRACISWIAGNVFLKIDQSRNLSQHRSALIFQGNVSMKP